VTAPKVGDRVRVEFEGEVWRSDQDARTFDIRLDGSGEQFDRLHPVYATVYPEHCEVIVPPIKVGDLVTAENITQLPIGSIIATSVAYQLVDLGHAGRTWNGSNHTYAKDADILAEVQRPRGLLRRPRRPLHHRPRIRPPRHPHRTPARRPRSRRRRRTPAGAAMIDQPGLYPDLDTETYHADAYAGGSLSFSGAKTLLFKTPALFAYEREHGRPDKRTFQFGRAAHSIVLGDGPALVVVQKTTKDKQLVDADDYKTASAQQHAREITEAGDIPVLRDQLDVVNAMADAIRAHPLASSLLAPGSGRPEVSAFATDPLTGITMRCRYDWLREPANGRLVLPDYKTTADADADAFMRSANDYGYPMQEAWYSTVARRLGLAADVEFLFVAQEKTPPYLVNVIQLDHTAARIGEVQMRRALALFRECTDTGVWPGYPSTHEPVLAPLPPWVEREYEQEMEISA
jgi:hypothetical protein